MSDLVIEHKGNFQKSMRFLDKMRVLKVQSILQKAAQMGLDALRSNTPVDTGKTANSWRYEISMTDSKYVIEYFNSNVVNGVNIAIIMDKGHATKNGGYVRGYRYISKSIRPIFDRLADDTWKEIRRA